VSWTLEYWHADEDRPHTETFHKELDRLGIKHIYNNDLKVKHHWNTGWLKTVVEELVKLS